MLAQTHTVPSNASPPKSLSETGLMIVADFETTASGNDIECAAVLAAAGVEDKQTPQGSLCPVEEGGTIEKGSLKASRERDCRFGRSVVIGIVLCGESSSFSSRYRSSIPLLGRDNNQQGRLVFVRTMSTARPA